MLLPCVGEFFGFLGHLGGEVVLLGAVGFEVVERPGVAFGGDELPVADADGFVVFVQPPEAVAGDGFVFGKGSDEALARRRGDGFAFPVLGLLDADEFEHGGHDVDDVRGCGAQFVLCSNSRRPMRNEGRADAAFMHPCFVTTMRCVCRAGEAGAEAKIGFGAAWRRCWIVTAIADHDLGTGTVVGGEKDERVFKSTHLLELRDDAADFLIHAVHHGSVDGHLGGLEATLLIVEFSPWQWTIHFARAERFHGIRKSVRRADFAF